MGLLGSFIDSEKIKAERLNGCLEGRSLDLGMLSPHRAAFFGALALNHVSRLWNVRMSGGGDAEVSRIPSSTCR